jgi:hypothetical protein
MIALVILLRLGRNEGGLGDVAVSRDRRRINAPEDTPITYFAPVALIRASRSPISQSSIAVAKAKL